ncbi:lysozyme inhibitor LprI family protein [Luteibacter aegosomatis]|uniref:lysozyme inhibitor LprI family protein n=1 Tax=Luteibacter aegosomatis TaxID=2911537 RepID=UPI001FFBB1F8|nr:lysozyme inhibitor LprI family protein [Luteibacter aegosomatis]UPG86579.1 lysozyme inhibitor LprI family protein [Luteibacter aegosomatis]
MSLRYAAATLLLACASVGVANAAAPETINGIAIMPGVERLSHVSDTYYGVRPAYEACVDGTKGRVADQGDCADDEFTYQDGRLNKAYKALMAQLATDKQATTDAQAAQRAWLAFMQKDCAARAPRFGSDAAPATESICRMEATAQRAQQLEDWLMSLTKRGRS